MGSIALQRSRQLLGDPGETNIAANPGLYWFLFEFRSNGRVTNYWRSGRPTLYSSSHFFLD